MAKNYATIYASANPSVALNHRMYVKEEATRGTMVAPLATDFMLHTGGSIESTQPFETSPHKTGRHNTSIIEQKFEANWNIAALFNIDTAVAAGTTEIDLAVRTLFKSALGKEDTSGTGIKYTAEDDPSITFTIHEVGDKWSKQMGGGFVDSATMNFPGDGNANYEMSGLGKKAILIGIGKSTTDNNAGNTITVQTDEGKRFKEDGLVMIIEADGTTRSADTATARKITDVTGDVITVDGAVLADADGSSADIYLVYWEPESPTAIDDIQTGLVGSFETTGLGTVACMRSFSLNLTNNHEPQNFCWGSDSLSGQIFAPADRLTAEASMELNLGHNLIQYYNQLDQFAGDNVVLILGDATGRHLKVTLPKAMFNIPPISVPETGTIPVTFDGTALQSALDQGDEVQIEFL